MKADCEFLCLSALHILGPMYCPPKRKQDSNRVFIGAATEIEW